MDNTSSQSIIDQTDSNKSENDTTNLSQTFAERPQRKRKKPSRYNDDEFIQSFNDSISTDSGRYYKVKRILAKRETTNGPLYLVHFVGEPAQNARWLEENKLDVKTRKLMKSKPPPLIE